MVEYCNAAGEVEFSALCAHGIDMDFGLRDLLTAIGLNHEVVAHYLKEDDQPLGIVRNNAVPLTLKEDLEALLHENDQETTGRSTIESMRIAAGLKDYGFGANANVVDIPVDAISRLLQDGCVAAATLRPHWDRDSLMSLARCAVYRKLTATYNGDNEDEGRAAMAVGMPVVYINGCLDKMEDVEYV